MKGGDGDDRLRVGDHTTFPNAKTKSRQVWQKNQALLTHRLGRVVTAELVDCERARPEHDQAGMSSMR